MSPHVANLDAPEFVGQPSGVFNVLAVTLQFPDKPLTLHPEWFDDIMFDENRSVANYYDNQSLGGLRLTTRNLPSQIAVVTMPHPYSYYVQDNYGFGTYPNNTQGLAEDAAKALFAAGIDFKPYDNNGDGFVDGLVLIHPGSGAELTGNSNDIWSHKWAFPSLDVGGVRVSKFSMQPEFWQTPGDMTIGVYCHEIAHLMGLPDLYDTDNSSKGLGRHCLMAAGSWNGRLGSNPAGLSAYCRVKLGFIVPDDINNTEGLLSFFPNEIMIHHAAPGATRDYYLMEYRKGGGYNWKEGFQILRVSDHGQGNSKEWRPGWDPSKTYQVAVIQADNQWSLERNTNSGDQNDYYPTFFGSVESTPLWQRDFGPETSPSSRWYDGSNTGLAVRDIQLAEDGSHVTAIVGGGMVRFSAEFVYGLLEHIFAGGEYNPDYDVTKDGFADSIDFNLAVDSMTDVEKLKLWKMFQQPAGASGATDGT